MKQNAEINIWSCQLPGSWIELNGLEISQISNIFITAVQLSVYSIYLECVIKEYTECIYPLYVKGSAACLLVMKKNVRTFYGYLRLKWINYEVFSLHEILIKHHGVQMGEMRSHKESYYH